MKKLLLAILAAISIFSSFTCDSTEPVEEIIEPGSRNYDWYLDTLDTQMNSVYAVWAASENDIWAAGPGGISAYDELWHFDGKKWKTYNRTLFTNPECLFGFSTDNILLGGSEGKIFRFNGNIWELEYEYPKDSLYSVSINYIYGTNPNNIYALGYYFTEQNSHCKAFVLHFNGAYWRKYFESKSEINSTFIKVRKENHLIYLSELENTKNLSYQGIKFTIINTQNSQIIEIFNKSLGEITFASMCDIGNKVYFLIGQDLCVYNIASFEKRISFNNTMFGYQVFGRSEKDIFVRMLDGLAHYNGSNLEYLINFENNRTSIFANPIIGEDYVVFAIQDYVKDLNLILRGMKKH